jgi:CDP-diacylglycerol--inositol 3-phosphatidyltransferase
MRTYRLTSASHNMSSKSKYSSVYFESISPQQTYLSLIILDISSHWCQMYSTSALGVHHKSEKGNEGRSFLVRWFYKYYYFFGYCCVSTEFTYIVAYVLQFSEGLWCHVHLKMVLALCLPGCAMKQAVNVAQLQSACYAVAAFDAEAKNK